MNLRKNKYTKTSIILLLLLLSILIFKYFSIANDYENYTKNSELEIQLLESQIDEILTKYDSLGVESKNNKTVITNLIKEQQKILREQERIGPFYSEVEISNITPSQKATTKLNSNQNKKELSVININTKGVKIFSDFYNKNNYKIQQLRVCYTLLSNSMETMGVKRIYIQVVNPKNQIISKENSTLENADGVVLKYSAFSEINFANQDIDACAFVDLEENKTIKGKYIVNIYSDFIKIGSSIFEYK
jgi:hypothetical protein